MPRFYRLLRRALALLFFLIVIGAVVYYIVYTLTGIFDEIDHRAEVRDRDALLVQTASAIAPTIAAESLNLAHDAPPEVAAVLPSDTPEPTTAPSATPEPTAAPSDTPEPTTPPSDTPEPTAAPSDTPEPTTTPSDTPEPTHTPEPTEIAQRATLLPTNTDLPTLIPTNTARPSATPSLTPSATLTPSQTNTPTQTLTPSNTPTLTLTPSDTPTYTPTSTPTETFTPTNTPTPSPSPYPIEGTYATPVTTPIIAFPPRAPLVEDDPNIVNVVLLGADSRGDNLGRTDVTIVVSVHKDAGTVAMWHIPRDLLVYIPGYTVDRVNLAYQTGIQSGYPGGGAGLVKETLLYNFGIEVDYYARVNFTDFEEIIQTLDGLQISIDCQITDWALISPELDPTVPENWEEYTMRIGRQTLTPYYALWYSRSRVTTSDFDRGRRQLDVLRAIFSQARGAGLLTQITDLYPQLLQIVDTDVDLNTVLEFLPLASNLEINRIERFNGVLGVHFDNFTTPDDGRAVLIPRYDAIWKLAQDLVTPPTANRVDRIDTLIEVYDVSAYGIGFDLVASDRLAWEGFAAIPMGQVGGVRKEVTTIYDYTGAQKGSALEAIMQILRVGPSSVVIEPDPNRTVDFKIEIGTSYNSCFIGSSADLIDEGPPVEREEEIEQEEGEEPQTVG